MFSGVPKYPYAAELRRELSLRNRAFARSLELPHAESYGTSQVIVYEPYAEGTLHGNFIVASYSAIVQNESWYRRLSKVHAQARQTLPKCDRRWMELDSSASSDALLMNIFCYPGVLSRVAGMLGLDDAEQPTFGYRARVPLKNGRFDRTEVDMKIGSLLVESKLTESDFQVKDSIVLESYRDFAEVFDTSRLLGEAKVCRSYQLVRNVLAANAASSSFCVCLDARRPDLAEEWYRVMCCVRAADLKTRCKVLTWQELSAVLPAKLQSFLDLKYGIVPPGRTPSPIPGFEASNS